MDAQFIAGLALLAAVISNGLTVWNFLQSPSRKNANDISALRDDLGAHRHRTAAECKVVEDSVDALATRVNTIETQMMQMPDKDSQHRLEMSVSDMRGEFKELRADLRPVAAIAERMQEMMMQQAAQANFNATPPSRGARP